MHIEPDIWEIHSPIISCAARGSWDACTVSNTRLGLLLHYMGQGKTFLLLQVALQQLEFVQLKLCHQFWWQNSKQATAKEWSLYWHNCWSQLHFPLPTCPTVPPVMHPKTTVQLKLDVSVQPLPPIPWECRKTEACLCTDWYSLWVVWECLIAFSQHLWVSTRDQFKGASGLHPQLIMRTSVLNMMKRMCYLLGRI